MCFCTDSVHCGTKTARCSPPFVTSLMQYLKSGPPQLQDMSSRLNDWFERSMMISMALDFNRAIWSSAVSSLEHTDTVYYCTATVQMFTVRHKHWQIWFNLLGQSQGRCLHFSFNFFLFLYFAFQLQGQSLSLYSINSLYFSYRNCKVIEIFRARSINQPISAYHTYDCIVYKCPINNT